MYEEKEKQHKATSFTLGGKRGGVSHFEERLHSRLCQSLWMMLMSDASHNMQR